MWTHKIGKKDGGTELYSEVNEECMLFAALSQPRALNTTVVPNEQWLGWPQGQSGVQQPGGPAETCHY